MKRKKEEKPLTIEIGHADRDKLMKFPWPWKDSSIEEIKIVDVIPFVPARDRPRFMDELYRVLLPEAKATITTIYYSHMGATSDFRVEWPPLSEQSFLYFNKGWREANKVDFPMKCDFDFQYGYNLEADLAARHQDVQTQAIKANLNTVQRLHVVLTKRK